MEQEFSQGCIPREGQKTLIMHMQSPLTSRLGTVKVQAAQTWNQWYPCPLSISTSTHPPQRTEGGERNLELPLEVTRFHLLFLQVLRDLEKYTYLVENSYVGATY